MEDFTQGFIEEALELTAQLEELLLGLENRDVTVSDIQEIFRVMHTIKGSSAMFGFKNTEKLSHKIEDIFDLIRDKQLEVNSEIITLTVETVDTIKLLLKNEDKPEGDVQIKLEALFKKASGFLPNGEMKTIDDDGKDNSLDESPATAVNYFYIFFKPDSDILLRGIAPIGVFEELVDLGQVTGFPYIDEVPSIENYDPASFFLGWDIFIKTQENLGDIEDCFMFYLENEYKIIPVDPQKIDSDQIFLGTCLNMNRGNLTIDEVKQKLSTAFNFEEEEEGQTINAATDQSENLTSDKKKAEAKTIESIKVESKKLDELINLVSELVTLNSKLEIQTSSTGNDLIKKTVKDISKLSKRFRDNALELRLIPVKVMILKLQRLIRDLSKTLNKEVEFLTDGTSTELDKNILAKLEAPLMHILRNSIDHGIEHPDERMKAGKPPKGVIRFVAFYSGSNVFIQIQDDGRGMDVNHIIKKAIDKGIIDKGQKMEKSDVFNLLFAPGFSTAEDVTHISGRGVGLDVVKKEITEMRGEIDIESEKGLGTSFTLKLPLTLSIIDTLMAKVGATFVLFPREFIVQTRIFKQSKGQFADNIEFENRVLPVINLRNDFSIYSETPNTQYDIIVRQYDNLYVIRVDKILGEHQAVVKPLGYYSQEHNYFSGASILGDGSLAFILDVNKVINQKKFRSSVGQYNLK